MMRDGLLLPILFLFFKQKTAYEMRISDSSSDVCSSDLRLEQTIVLEVRRDHARQRTAERRCRARIGAGGHIGIGGEDRDGDAQILPFAIVGNGNFEPLRTRRRRFRSWGGILCRSEERRVGKECVGT